MRFKVILLSALLFACTESTTGSKSDDDGHGGTGGDHSEGGASGDQTAGVGGHSEGGSTGEGGQGGDGGDNMAGENGAAGSGGMPMGGSAGASMGGSAGQAPAAPKPDAYVYVGGDAGDIVRFKYDPATGNLSDRATSPTGGGNLFYLARNLAGTRVFSVTSTDQARSYSVNAGTGALTALNGHPAGGGHTVHVSVHPSGGWIFASNYNGANVSVFPVEANGQLGARSDLQSSGSESHQIMPDRKGDHVFVPCRGPNHVALFKFNSQTGKLTANSPATVSSDDPRHIAFHPNNRTAYLLNENPANVVSFAYDEATGRLTSPQKINLANGENWGSHLMVTPNGKFVYAAGRRQNLIVIFEVNAQTGRLTRKGDFGSNINRPRDFSMDAEGRHLFVANEGNGRLVVLSIGQDGTLTQVGDVHNAVNGARAVTTAPGS